MEAVRLLLLLKQPKDPIKIEVWEVKGNKESEIYDDTNTARYDITA